MSEEVEEGIIMVAFDVSVLRASLVFVLPVGRAFKESNGHCS